MRKIPQIKCYELRAYAQFNERNNKGQLDNSVITCALELVRLHGRFVLVQVGQRVLGAVVVRVVVRVDGLAARWYGRQTTTELHGRWELLDAQPTLINTH